MLRSTSWVLAVLPFLLLLQACAPQKPQAEEPCGFVQNSYGQRVSWKSDVPVALYVQSGFPAEYQKAIEIAVQAWEIKAGRPLFKIVSWDYNGSDQPRKDGVSVIYWMNTWDANKPTEQARTSIYWEGNQLREADMRINAMNFKYYIDTPVDAGIAGQVHLPSLIIHELGHVLGLAHKDAQVSVMNTYLASQTKRTDLTKTDLDSLKCEY